MDHVGAGHQDVHDLVHRHDHLVVDRQQARLAGLEVLLGDHQRVEFEIAVVGIAVAPEPLLAGRLHGEVRRRHVELQEQQPERRDRDQHQDDDRNDRPDDFERRVVRGARRGRIGARIEAHDDDQEQDQNEQRNRGDDPKQEIIEAGDVVHDRRGRILQAHLPRRRLPEPGERRSRRPQITRRRSAQSRSSVRTPSSVSLLPVSDLGHDRPRAAQTIVERRPQQYDAACFRRGLRHDSGSLAGIGGMGESQFLKPQIGGLLQCTRQRVRRA